VTAALVALLVALVLSIGVRWAAAVPECKSGAEALGYLW
jgi:hypothetical protein